MSAWDVESRLWEARKQGMFVSYLNRLARKLRRATTSTVSLVSHFKATAESSGSPTTGTKHPPNLCSNCGTNIPPQQPSRGKRKVEVKPCPCGRTPDTLYIQPQTDHPSKWGRVFGSCCSEWEIEFRLQYTDPNSEEGQALALEAWNMAARGKLIYSEAELHKRICEAGFAYDEALQKTDCASETTAAQPEKE